MTKAHFHSRRHTILSDGLLALLTGLPDGEIIGESEEGREAVRGAFSKL